jgi:hypothetical protein
LSRQHQEDKHQRERKNDGSQIAGLELLIGYIGPLGAESGLGFMPKDECPSPYFEAGQTPI